MELCRTPRSIPAGGGTNLAATQAGLRGRQATAAGPFSYHWGLVCVDTYTYDTYSFQRSNLLGLWENYWESGRSRLFPSQPPRRLQESVILNFQTLAVSFFPSNRNPPAEPASWDRPVKKALCLPELLLPESFPSAFPCRSAEGLAASNPRRGIFGPYRQRPNTTKNSPTAEKTAASRALTSNFLAKCSP